MHIKAVWKFQTAFILYFDLTSSLEAQNNRTLKKKLKQSETSIYKKMSQKLLGFVQTKDI